MFADYQTTNNIAIGRVGGIHAHACGKGTIRLLAQLNAETRQITLHDMLHVSDSKHNLLSLEQWENNGQLYHAKDSIITLNSSDGTPIA